MLKTCAVLDEKIERDGSLDFLHELERFRGQIVAHPSKEERKAIEATLIDAVIFIQYLTESGLFPKNRYPVLANSEFFKGNFYPDFLQPLFRTLDTPYSHQDFSARYSIVPRDLPHLNSGVFSPFRSPRIRVNDDSLVGLVRDVIPRYSWTLGSSSTATEDEPKPHIRPWVLGYIYERWTENRKAGSHYTHDLLAYSIVSHAITEWLEIKYKSEFDEAGTLSEALEACHRSDLDKASRYVHVFAWLSATLPIIKLIDLSVGGGAFLVAASKFIYELASFSLRVTKKGSTLDQLALLRSIFADNIFGVDIDDDAIRVAKMRLWLAALEFGALDLSSDTSLPALENLAIGNALDPISKNSQTRQESFLNKLEPIPSTLDRYTTLTGGFDICVGNPPFIPLSQRSHVAEKSEFISYWNNAHPDCKVRTTSDLSNFFILRGAEILRSNGVLVYITSRNFFDTRYGEPIRKFLTEQTELRHIFTLHEHPFIQEGLRVKANTVIICLANRAPTVPVTFQHLMKWDMPLTDSQGSPIDRERLARSDNWTQTLFEDPLRNELLEKCKRKLSDFASAKMGIKTGCNSFFLIKEDSPVFDLLVSSLRTENLVKVVKNSREIRGYSLPAETPYRLLNLSQRLDGIELGYSNLPESRKPARYIYENGVKYPCSNCQSLAKREHREKPNLYPHRGMCQKCKKCRAEKKQCDRPIDRLSTQGHSPEWYTLKLGKPPVIAVQCIVDTEIGVFWNESCVYATDQFQIIESFTRDDYAPLVFLFLISRVSHFLLEGMALHRARYDGSFMLKIQVAHLNDLPCPDLSRLDPASKEKMLRLFDAITSGIDRKSREAITLRDETDNIFLRLMGYQQTDAEQVQSKMKTSLNAAILFRWEKTNHRNGKTISHRGGS